MILTVTDIENTASEFQSLIDFCLENCMYIVLTRRHTGGIPRETLRALADERITQLKERKNENVKHAETEPISEIRKYRFGNRNSMKRQLREKIYEVYKYV